MKRILECGTECLESFARLLQSTQGDECTEDLVGSFEDHVDPCISHGLLVRELLGVANSASDLHRFACSVYCKFRRKNFARSCLERIVDMAAIHHLRRQHYGGIGGI